MVIPKYIYIPLLILIPLVLLLLGALNQDLTKPPSEVLEKDVLENWEGAFIQQQQDGEDNGSGFALNTDSVPPLDLLFGAKVKSLRKLMKDLTSDEDQKFLYLAYERMLDSAPDSTARDRRLAHKYLKEHPCSLLDPRNGEWIPLSISIVVQPKYAEAFAELGRIVEADIFYGSGGIVRPKLTVKESRTKQNTLTLEGGRRQCTVAFKESLNLNAETMLMNAIQKAVTQAIKQNNLPILYTDEIPHTHYTRLCWVLLAEALQSPPSP